jgi:hypothetical protein
LQTADGTDVLTGADEPGIRSLHRDAAAGRRARAVLCPGARGAIRRGRAQKNGCPGKQRRKRENTRNGQISLHHLRSAVAPDSGYFRLYNARAGLNVRHLQAIPALFGAEHAC